MAIVLPGEIGPLPLAFANSLVTVLPKAPFINQPPAVNGLLTEPDETTGAEVERYPGPPGVRQLKNCDELEHPAPKLNTNVSPVVIVIGSLGVAVTGVSAEHETVTFTVAGVACAGGAPIAPIPARRAATNAPEIKDFSDRTLFIDGRAPMVFSLYSWTTGDPAGWFLKTLSSLLSTMYT